MSFKEHLDILPQVGLVEDYFESDEDSPISKPVIMFCPCQLTIKKLSLFKRSRIQI